MLVSYAIFQSAYVQTYATKNIAYYLSKKFKTNITVKNVDIAFFNKIVLKGVYISDQSNDTLVYIKRLKAQLKSVHFSHKSLMLNKIEFDNSCLNISSDSLNNYNFSFFFKSLKSTNTKKSEWNIYCNNFKVKNSVFSYKSKGNMLNNSKLINFNDLYLTNLNFTLKDIYIDSNSVNYKINNLSFIDKSGFKINNLSVAARIYKHSIVLNNVSVSTAFSNLNTKFFTFRFNNLSDFRDFNKKVKFHIYFAPSKIGLADLSFFIPNLKGVSENFYFSGDLQGKVNKFRGNNIKIYYGNESYVYCNLSMNGLPDFKKTFMYVNVNKLFTDKKDIETLKLYRYASKKHIKLPKIVENLGSIMYDGKITGFVYDFVSYGKFTTDLGDISTDISIKTNLINKEVDFEGTVKSNLFNLGKFVDQDKIFGNININTTINGSVSENSEVNAKMNGTFGRIEFNKYILKNVKINGNVSNTKFEGSVNINDPNLKMQFLGDVDFSNQTPLFDFTADVAKANLYKLNIDKKDTLSELSFLFISKFKGDNFDNADGEINIYKTNLNINNKKLNIKEILILSEKKDSLKHILFNSDLIDAEAIGDFKPKSFMNSINNLIYVYLPVLKKDTIDHDSSITNNLKFTVNLKDINPITDIFFPSIKLSKNTLITGAYTSNNNLTIETKAYKLVFADNSFNDFSFNLNSDDSVVTAYTRCKELYYTNKYSLKNINILASLSNNNVDFGLKWFSNDSSEYSGDIKINTKLFQSSQSKNLAADISIPKSEIVIDDSIWTINKCNIQSDSSSFNFNNLIIKNNNQYISINGKISKNNNDFLFARINDFDISDFNILTNNSMFKVAGIMNGDIKLSSFYDSLFVDSKFRLNNFFLNNKKVGDINASSEWNDNTKKININAFIVNDKIKTFSINGDFVPKTKQLDFDLNFNKTPLRILEPYFFLSLTDVSGTARGKLKLTGLTFKPLLNGNLITDNAEFTVDYLKTRYHFKDTVQFKNDTLIFNKINAFDIYNNKAVCDGYISNNYFKDWYLNLNINAKNLLAINTKERDNNLYYGIGYASGLIKIYGPARNLIFDISATTEKNTKIYIPVTQSESLSRNSFITFIGNQKVDKIENKNVKMNSSGIQLNFDLHVTPDAEAVIIFDSKVGDLIKGKGFADLNLKVDKKGKFSIFGDYNIESGNYLFTLQNIINKKFVIQKGSSISWNGDPYDADINLDAAYKVKKTSLYDLTLNQEDMNKRYPVDCHLLMTNKLMNPTLKFKITFPTSPYIQAKSQINSLPQDELSKQILSLLLINKFQHLPGTEVSTENNVATSGVGTNASELLSNQLSNWLSQISNDFDIGFNYRPGDDMTPKEYEVALSTQLLNNRVSINGNVGVGGQQLINKPINNNANNIVGDFMVDVKINKSGKFHVKAFTRENDDINYDASPYIQGVGFSYREEFNTVDELFRRYWQKIFSKNK